MLVVSGVDVCHSESWLPPHNQGLRIKVCVCVVMFDRKVCALHQCVPRMCFHSVGICKWLGQVYLYPGLQGVASVHLQGAVCAGFSGWWTHVLWVMNVVRTRVDSLASRNVTTRWLVPLNPPSSSFKRWGVSMGLL